MPGKNFVITIITHFLFKSYRGKFKTQNSVHFPSRNHYNAEIAIRILFLQFLEYGKDDKDILVSGLFKKQMICAIILHQPICHHCNY